MMRGAALIGALALLGCAEEPPQPTFWDLRDRPIPTDAVFIDQECAWLDREIARQQTLMQMSQTSQYALAFMAKGRDNIAALNSRKSQIGCDVQRVEVVEKKDIDACFKKCRELTSRTEEACFDACK